MFLLHSRREAEGTQATIISLTSIPGKIMESSIRGAMLDHLLQHKRLTNDHLGFLPQRSCDVQLLSCMEEWAQLLET